MQKAHCGGLPFPSGDNGDMTKFDVVIVGAGAAGDAVAAGAGAAAGSTLSPEDGRTGSGALMTSKRSAK